MIKLPKYIPSLDGLRALSIIAVILFHLQVPFLSLGWSGVNLFFVLSGFLITGILLDAKGDPHYFKNFYARRVLRIFPVYYLVLFGTTVLLLVLGNWGLSGKRLDFVEFLKAFPYYLTYLQNFFLAYHQGQTPFPQLSHTWSLAIEEQFYFLWPLIVYKLPVKKTMLLSVVLIILAPILRLGVAASTSNVYYQDSMIFTQFDQLAFGALLACLVRSKVFTQHQMIVGAKRIMALSGLSLVVYIIAYGSRMGQPTANTVTVGLSGSQGVFGALTRGLNSFWFPEDFLASLFGHTIYTILGLFFFGLVAFVVLNPSCYLSRFLKSKALVHIGGISYGLYLFHLPIFRYVSSFTRYLFPNNESLMTSIPASIVKVGITYGVAVISWNTIEKLFLSFKKYFLSSEQVSKSGLKDHVTVESQLDGEPGKEGFDASITALNDKHAPRESPATTTTTMSSE